MVEKILEHFPIAQYDVNEEKKNMVLLAVEHRQPHLCEFLLSLKKKNIIKDSVFYQLDCYGNSALHLAANIVNFQWPVPGASSQMQWEIKWFEYIKSFMPKNILLLQNKKGKTPDDIFKESHKKLVDDGGQWLSRTSEACTVVAGLFVTATYTTSTTVPGGVKQESGTPYLENKMSFQIFAVSSLISFYSSLIAVVMFLAIFTSGCRERDFRYTLPLKLLMGLTAFYASIASTLISFSTGHFFILKDQLKSVAFPLYIGVCLLVTFFSMAVFPLFFHLAWATFKKVPQRNYEVTPF
ncbi:hypothetical protein RGQ29_009098 [Quercus rubra]|uniref:PGG domain-containing protein n=1 Tax=Quercus rubra TaxID=3512 RepID=A0AAN7E227_QUERU|nr:hypothetical protein RGQ29_009098 [Quercus rubra]